MRHALGGLAAAALAAGILACTPAALHANGTLDNHPEVRIFTPTPSVQDTAAPQAPAPQRAEVVVHVLLDDPRLNRDYRSALAFRYRQDRIRSTLGHRYTGFVRMYRGPRYPF